MTRAELLAELVAEHFGNYTREYHPIPDYPDDDPDTIAERRADIDVPYHEETLEAAA